MKTTIQTPNIQTTHKNAEPILTPEMLNSIRKILLGDKSASKQLKAEINVRYS